MQSIYQAVEAHANGDWASAERLLEQVKLINVCEYTSGCIFIKLEGQ